MSASIDRQRVHVRGLGLARPGGSLPQKAYLELACASSGLSGDPRRFAQLVYRGAGVERRGSVLLDAGERDAWPVFYPPQGHMGVGAFGPTTGERMRRYELEAPALASRAVVTALADAAMTADSIAHLITVSCTGFRAPGVDVSLIRDLDFAPNVSRTHVGFMGCHGAMNGLRVAAALAAPGEAALVCAVELCTLHYSYRDIAQQIVANGLFADGAAAAVLVRDDATKPQIRLLDSTSMLLPDGADSMAWCVGDHGFEMSLAPEVPGLIGRQAGAPLVEWLASHELAPGDIGGWAVHPGGPRVLDAVGDALSLDAQALDHARAVLAEDGNMSSPTVLFVLERLRAAKTPGPWVALGFGPGLAIEAALLESPW